MNEWATSQCVNCGANDVLGCTCSVWLLPHWGPSLTYRVKEYKSNQVQGTLRIWGSDVGVCQQVAGGNNFFVLSPWIGFALLFLCFMSA